MKRNYCFLLGTLFVLLSAIPIHAFAQNAPPAKPKLVIGIVVDQMRYDFLYRYQSKYGQGGFNRLLREGFSCENTHYNYIPTYTAPGHTAIYSGATPAVNGIIGNEWWDPEWGKHRYVTTDTTVKTVGSVTPKAGQHSPRVLLSTTVTDELRLGTNFQSKVVGVCLKDRASILPAGHIPNACYWFDDKTGNWITSSYYPDSMGLPQWVQDFNAKKLPDIYLSRPWMLDTTHQYDESYKGWEKFNDGKYGDFPGELPYDLPALKTKDGYGVIRFTPYGNILTTDFAIETIEKMGLGMDTAPDFLCLSYSSTDYCAHQFGIHSAEMEDVYIRMDKDIARLLNFIDRKFGKNNVLVFLTADHGGAETPAHLASIGIPAGVFDESLLEPQLEKVIADAVGTSADYIFEIGNQQIWLNKDLIESRGLSRAKIDAAIAKYLRAQPGVYDVYNQEQLMALPDDYPFASLIRRGIHPRRSGEIFFQLDPAWHPDDKAFKFGGTTHGSSYPYDTHVPLLWYGWRIPQGASYAPVDITDIAPTVSAMLRIMEPNGSTGKIIEPLMKN